MPSVRSSARTRSHVNCCVPQCSTYYGGDISFHKLPTNNPRLKKEWARVLKIGKKISKYMMVCSKHFKKEDYFFNKEFVIKYPRLKRNSIPSQNLPKTSHSTQVRQKLPIQRLVRGKNKKHFNIQNSNEGDLKAAEIFLSLQKTLYVMENKPITRNFEDKGVQVNTYEDFQDFDVMDMTDTENKLKGLINFSLLNVLVAASDSLPETKLPVEKIIILTMMRMKLYVPFSALAIFFNIGSAVTTRNYFNTTVQHLAVLLQSAIRIPPKEH